MIEAGSVVVRFIGDDKSMKAASKRFFTSMGKIAKAAAIAGIAVAAASAKMAADFDKGMREISTLITDVTDNDIKVMSNEIKRLGIESGQSLKSISKGLYDITSAGFTKASDGALVLAASTKLAVGGVTDVANAADIVTTALNSYQLQAKDATLVSDILFTTVRLGKTTMTELGASLGQVLPFSNAADLSLRGVGAAMATITASGINTRIATTALKNAMFSLAAPMESAKEAMAADGIEIKRLDDGTMDLLATIKQFRGLSLDEIRKFIPEKRAATAILSMAQNFDKLKANLIEFQDVSGATETANEKMQKSFAVQFAKIKNIVQVTMITLGEEILPAIIPAIQEIGDYLVTHAENIASFFKKIGDVVAAVFADFNTFVMAATGIIFAINGIELAFAALNIVASANPIGLLVTTVAVGIPFIISLFKKLSSSVDTNMTHAKAKMDEFGYSIDEIAVKMANLTLEQIRQELYNAERDFAKAQKAIEQALKFKTFGGLEKISTDGILDVDKIKAKVEELKELYKSLDLAMPEKIPGKLLGGLEYRVAKRQLVSLADEIDMFNAYISSMEDVGEAREKLKAQLELIISPAPITPEIIFDFSKIDNTKINEMDFGLETLELAVDEFYDVDAAEAQALAVAMTGEKLTQQQQIQIDKQKAMYSALGSYVQSVASMMGSAFAAFSQDLLDDNISIKDSFKNLWNTIVTNFIASIAAMIGQLLLLFAVYTALNLASGGALGGIIAMAGGATQAEAAAGGFFQGLIGALFGGGLSGGNISDAFVKDAIITPGGNIIHTDPQDYLFAAKDPSVIPAMAGASGGGNVNVNINIRAMDGSDVYRTLTDNAGKVNKALNTIVGRHFK